MPSYNLLLHISQPLVLAFGCFVAPIALAGAALSPVAPQPHAPSPHTSAHLFVDKCAGCHTVGQGEQFGPDLQATSTWAVKDLREAIERMEPFLDDVGDDEINRLVELLRSADAAAQIADAQERIARSQTATSESASAAVRQALAASLDHSVPTLDPSVSPGAKLYLQKCSGCHTIGRGNLSGPDLKAASAWPASDLRVAVQRMEKSVGPMDDAEINLLVDLLLNPNAGIQVENAQQQVAMAQSAKIEPGSPDLGKMLFHGKRSFGSGGLACSACHAAEGRGGAFAADLHTSFARFGAMPLMSSMENPGFALMRAVYGPRPITKQEAAHVTSYLESIADQPAPAGAPPVHAAGLGLAAATMAGIAFGYRNRLRGVRAKLIKRNTKY